MLATDDSGSVVCYQCKKVESFSPGDISATVSDFLRGKWSKEAKAFVLCCTDQLDSTQHVEKIRLERAQLRQLGYEFTVWEASEAGLLAELLKPLPELVADFFGRSWASRFCVARGDSDLNQRPDGVEFASLRSKLLRLYSSLFQLHDPGLPLGQRLPGEIVSRYIRPDVVETRVINRAELEAPNPSPPEPPAVPFRQEVRVRRPAGAAIRVSARRIPVEQWLTRNRRAVILGEPGFGKSTLLRFMALKILQPSDSASTDFQLFASHLPVWLSFGGFTSAIARDANLSLEDYFEAWLHQHSADEIAPFFRQALKHRDVLFLIDGLDEGTTPLTAQQGIERLIGFLATRDIPTIFTSRPLGFEQNKPIGDWSVAYLAPLSDPQAKLFAARWFSQIEGSPAIADNGTIDPSPSALKEAEHFFQAVKAEPRTLEIAGNPLMCQLLIDLFRHSHQLPEHRVQIYEKVVELLVSTHPAARARAAGLLDDRKRLRELELREMLIRLALDIQEKAQGGFASVDDCIRSFKAFLCDEEVGPGLRAFEAQIQASEAIEHMKSRLGLLVERAPTELGFIHLSLQEYLAAEGVSRFEEQAQIEWLCRVWKDSKWRESVLSWFGINGLLRGSRRITEKGIAELKARCSTQWDRTALLQLRAQLACGDMGLTAKEARAAVEEAAGQVIVSPYEDYSRYVARQIAFGLRTPSVAERCREILSHWLPGHDAWRRAQLLRALSTWEPTADVVDAFFLALHDEDDGCRQAVAEGIAAWCRQGKPFGERLLRLVKAAAEVNVAEAGLYALLRGAPDTPGLPKIAEFHRHSDHPAVATNAIRVRIKLGIHDEKDRDRMFALLSSTRASFRSTDVIDGLVEGWAKDNSLRSRALKRIKDARDTDRSNREPVLAYLLQAFPGDEEIGEKTADYVRGSLFDDLLTSDAMINGFRGNDAIGDKVRELLNEYEKKYKEIFAHPNVMRAISLLPANEAKGILLRHYEEAKGARSKYWLMWGLKLALKDDPDIDSLLQREIARPAQEVVHLTTWVPELISDRESRVEWLTEVLRSEDKEFKSEAAAQLLNLRADPAAIDAVFHALEDRKIWFYHAREMEGELIRCAAHDPRVRPFIKTALEDMDGAPLSAVADGFRDNVEMRSRLLSIACPPPMSIRAEIYEALSSKRIPNETIEKLTVDVLAEDVGPSRTLAILARASAIADSGANRDKFVEKLMEETRAVGPEYESRRLSALAGLLALNEVKRAAECAKRDQSPGWPHWFHMTLNRDPIAARTIFASWTGFASELEALGDERHLPWPDLVRLDIATEALDYPATLDELRSYMRDHGRSVFEAEHISLFPICFAETELRDALLTAIRQATGWKARETALRTYGKTFAGNNEALIALSALSNEPGFRHNIAVALAYGWPTDKRMHLDPGMAESRIRNRPLYEVLAICAANPSEEVGVQAAQYLVRTTLRDAWYHDTEAWHSLLEWAAKPEVKSVLFESIPCADTSWSVTATSLLVTTGQVKDEDRGKLAKYREAVLAENIAIENFGLDFVAGRYRSLSQVLYPFMCGTPLS